MDNYSAKVIIGGVEFVLDVEKKYNKHGDNFTIKTYISVINKDKERFDHEIKWTELND